MTEQAIIIQIHNYYNENSIFYNKYDYIDYERVQLSDIITDIYNKYSENDITFELYIDHFMVFVDGKFELKIGVEVPCKVIKHYGKERL